MSRPAPYDARGRVEHSEIAGVTVVALVGEFDIDTVALLRGTFLDAINQESNTVVVDLSRTTFLDSMALGSLITARRRANSYGGYVRIAAPPAAMRRVFELTRLDLVFDIVDTVDEATAAPGPLLD